MRDWRGLDEAEKMRVIDAAKLARAAEQTSWTELSRALDVSRDALRINCSDDPYATRRHELTLKAQRRRRGAEYFSRTYGEPSHHRVTDPRPADIAARLAEIPEDTRSPSQRLMGDPMPGDFRRVGK